MTESVNVPEVSLDSLQERGSTPENVSIPIEAVNHEMSETISSAEPVELGDAIPTAAPARPGPQSHHAVNDIDFLELQIKKNGIDIAKTLEIILSAIPEDGELPPQTEIRALAEKQTALLQKYDVTTPAELCDLLRKVKKLDQTTAAVHGFASGVGFNGASAFLNFYGSDAIGRLLGVEEEPTLGQTAWQSGISGLILSLASMTLAPAVKNLFEDAYFTRPPRDRLPIWVDEARVSNAPGGWQAGHTTGLDFIKTYGVRNMLRLTTSTVSTAAGVAAETAKAVDNALDPVGGCFAGIAFNLMHNASEEKRGLGGLPYFLARDDFEACLKALNASDFERIKAGSRHLLPDRNSFSTIKKAVCNNLTTAEGWASHLSLASGFSGISTGAAWVRAMTGGNEVLTGLAKYGTMMGLYYLYGVSTVYGAYIDAKPSTDQQSGTSEDISMRAISDRQGRSTWRTSNTSTPQPEWD